MQILLVLVLAAVVVAGPWSTGISAHANAGQAFVDLEKVVDNYKKTAALKAGMRQQMDQKLDAIRKEEEELRTREEDLQFLNKDSEEYLKKTLDISTERYRLRLRAERLEKEWNATVVRAYTEIVGDINREIQALGKERGLTTIHRVGGSELNGSEVDEKEVVFKLKLRQVLYYDPALDLTDEVLDRLN